MKKENIERIINAANEAAASTTGISAETYAGMNDEERVLFNKTASLNEHLTLREIKERIGSTRGKQIMTVKGLRRTGTLVAAQNAFDCRMEVYDNGFAVYRTSHETVLRMEHVQSEEFEGDPNVGIGDQKFDLSDRGWGEAVMFAGEKRLDEKYAQHFNKTQVSLTGNGYSEDGEEETDMELAANVDVEAEVIEQDEKERLWSNTESLLPERQMQIVKLHIIERLGWTEIGEELGIAPSSAKITFDRAIKRLQKNKKSFEEFL